MFELNKLTKKYNTEYALNNVSFKITSGMNFIVGVSGSGKTSILKVLSGIDKDYEGHVSYAGQEIKTIDNIETYHNQVFGIITQEAQLLEELTVLENVLNPSYVSNNLDEKKATRILKELSILSLQNQLCSKLSGGEKQRVVMAREILKNPEVILADEPTAALDSESSKIIIQYLRKLSKSKIVIVVTHDESLIQDGDSVFEMDKAELINIKKNQKNKHLKTKKITDQSLSLMNGFKMSMINLKRKPFQYMIQILAIITSSILLFLPLTNNISASGDNQIDALLETYGEGILDISVAGSFMNAAGGDEDVQKGEVTQDISKVLDTYLMDPRVEHILFLQAFDNISINLEGNIKRITSSGNVPVFNKLINGTMPNNDKNEVLVPESYVKEVGLDNESILGKEISFEASVYNWDSGTPIVKAVNTEVIVTGVIDSNMIYEYEGKTNKFSIDDSFFFSKSAIDTMRQQANIEGSSVNLSIRANSAHDLIDLKNELNKQGIVPLGQFELLEDIVKLSNQTGKQTEGASIVFAGLAFVVIVSVSILSATIRQKEFAIYKLNGFNDTSLRIISLSEMVINAIISIGTMVLISPIISSATLSLWNVSISPVNLIMIIGFIILFSLLSSVIAYFKAKSSKLEKLIKGQH